MRHALVAVAAAILVTACSGTAGGGSQPMHAPGTTVRLGFVAEVSQAPALVGVADGLFAKNLGPGITVRPVMFRTDAAEEAALASGKLDAAYASPETILAVLRARGASRIKIISGAASGGAELVVSPGIHAPGDLRGRVLAVPFAGGSEDVALRHWLDSHRLAATATRSAGTVMITTGTPGPAAVQELRSGRIAGAWEPAPYDIEMLQGGDRALASEHSLPPVSQSPAANLVATQSFLRARPAAVIGLLKEQVQANEILHTSLIQANLAVGAELRRAGASLPTGVLAASLNQITFTEDPAASALISQAELAASPGDRPVPASALTSLYDLGPLNLILRVTGQPPVSA